MNERYTKKMLSDFDSSEELARLAAMSDDDIDTSDIPEITEAQWATARRGVPRKKAFELQLDQLIIEWFKSNATDGDFEADINRVLRRHMVETMRKASDLKA